MAEETSPFKLAKDIGAFVAQFVSSLDADSLPREERELVTLFKNQAVDLRLEVRDYGTAETRNEQERQAKAVARRVETMQATVLRASEFNLLGAADVALLSAQMQQLIDVL